ncbi:HAUS augmin-like complex subunit 8 isoform X2 [Lethenteron reissneri]|uniref:HAUS augmin-like complex subunit 8 isoform X2 n=1 Tax=Lethenteron reissneri TaxID=7753 RepID=UPI002AB7481C|nr:HAUS augmin-like complex subunit 8 isoform X2 [Lethenteron reissneri]
MKLNSSAARGLVAIRLQLDGDRVLPPRARAYQMARRRSVMPVSNPSTEDSSKSDNSSGATSSESSTGLQNSDSSNAKVMNKKKTSSMPSMPSQGRSVPSRYKQSAANVAERGNLDKTLLANKSLAKHGYAGRGFNPRPSLAVKAKPGLPMGSAVKQGSPTHSKRSVPGSAVQNQVCRRLTVAEILPECAHSQLQSTLTMGPDLSLLPSWDVSVLSALDERKGSQVTVPSARRKTDAGTLSYQPQKRMWTDDDLSLLYTDYLMSLYTYLQVDEGARRVEEEERESQRGRFKRNERLARKLQGKRELSERLEHTVPLNKQLAQQTQALSPLLEVLPGRFKESYGAFGEALEATRHRLPLHNIHVPDQDTQALSERLCDVLAETSALAANASGFVRDRLPGLTDTAGALADVKHGTQACVEEEECVEKVVLSLNALKLKELCLRVQEVNEAEVLLLLDGTPSI